MTLSDFDIAVVGAGIAGAAAAAELAKTHSVVLLEMEDQPGYHATGRSAAILAQQYGPPAIQALTRASEPFFQTPPEGFCETPLLSSRPIVIIARKNQLDSLNTEHRNATPECPLQFLDAEQVHDRVPLLRKDNIVAGLVNTKSQDIDVNALHRGFLRQFSALGGQLKCKAAVTELCQTPGGWDLSVGDEKFHAKIVVNAAGAWADDLARLASVPPLGLTPLRRTAITIDAPDGVDVPSFPMVLDADEQFYMKPEGGRLMASPADHTSSPACDARPEEIDVAICVDRICNTFDLNVRRIHSQWAGLRTFAPDGLPVCGFDAEAPGFFWLAGQGGYGIQTAPALAQLTSDLIRNHPLEASLQAAGVKADQLSPKRLSPKTHA